MRVRDWASLMYKQVEAGAETRATQDSRMKDRKNTGEIRIQASYVKKFRTVRPEQDSKNLGPKKMVALPEKALKCRSISHQAA